MSREKAIRGMRLPSTEPCVDVKTTATNTAMRERKRAPGTGSAQDDSLRVPGSKGVLLQVKGLTLRTRGGLSALSDLSFQVEPGELIVLTGPSRSGKSTLLRCLAGFVRPVSGSVFIDGVNLYPNLKSFQSSIGYVPAAFSLQQSLTVGEALQDSAWLRLPRAASRDDRQQRVRSLLETMGLTAVAEHRVGTLSGAEKRRLSIAIELIGEPGLLLVDESAEPLTPPEELQISTLLREIAHQGVTVVEVSEQSRSIELSDKVIFLAPQGTLAWFGPAEEAAAYFRGQLPEGAIKELFEPGDAIELLAGQQADEPTEWAKRFKAHAAYQTYVDDPLNNRYPDLMLQAQPLLRLRNSTTEKLPPAAVPHAGGLSRLILLIQRNSRLLWRDKAVLFMVIIPPCVALIDFVLSSATMLDPRLGDADRAPIALGLLVFLDLLTAALLAQSEIFKEKPVYRREQRTNSLLVPYVLSKIWLVLILAIYQGAVWTAIHFIAAIGAQAGADPQTLLSYAVTLSLVAFVGGVLGLMASSMGTSAATIGAWVLLLTVPQLFLSGSVIPLDHLSPPFVFLSTADPSRHAFETLLTLSGYGQDVVTDRCWQMPVDRRNSLSDDQKQGCTCMGVNIFSKCSFPGIYEFYTPAIEGQPSMARSLTIGRAEGVISEAVDHYGLAFNVDRYRQWSILAVMSVCLIVLLVGIQKVAGSVST